MILANKTDKPSKLLTKLAAWWDRIVKVNDEVTGKARAHMESNQASGMLLLLCTSSFVFHSTYPRQQL